MSDDYAAIMARMQRENVAMDLGGPVANETVRMVPFEFAPVQVYEIVARDQKWLEFWQKVATTILPAAEKVTGAPVTAGEGIQNKSDDGE